MTTELRIIPKRVHQSRKIESVMVVDAKINEITAPDGTTYTLDYGIEAVHERVIFTTPVSLKSKAMAATVASLSAKYPLARVVLN